jgi:hypothetical protein
MDPALRELLRSGADAELEEVEAIIRLDQPHVDVAGVRIMARFGPVATCRLLPDLILATWHDDNVVSLKCPRALGPEPVVDVGSRGDGSPPARDDRRPPTVTPTGAGVVVGVVDWGCDFDHPNLKHPDGTTRLLGLWDQRGPANDRSPQPYGYGTFHDRQRINAALGTSQPYDALGYHPAAADRDGRGAHGTHVIDIAAGNGLAGGPVGVAPGAHLLFVHLAERGAGGLANLGDSARILEAVDFISRVAGRRPWVINLSVGRCGGPHDGTTLAELALDHLVAAAPGRFIVQSAGNYFDRHTHATGRVEPGGRRTLTFVTDPADLTPNELEMWYPGGDELTTLLESPHGIRTPWIPLGEEGDIVAGGSVVGRIYHRRRDPNNGDHHIDLFLSPTAPAGVWNLTLEGVRVVRGGFDAWLERDEACGPCQARFVPDDVDRRTTTGTIANGRQPFVVGAYDGHSPTWTVAPFSSVGPTRDGRPKPDCVAPGVEVLAARSAPPGSARSPGLLTRKSGSSMAAPHVTGAVALCLEAARRPLASNEIRALLQRSLAPVPSGTPESPRLGGGYLDVGRLVAATTAIAPRKELHMEANPDRLAPALIRPDALYRHVAYRRDDPLPASIDQSYVIVARPGEVPRMRPDRGDILVRVALGERGLAHVAVLSSPELVPWQALDAAGMPHEREGPGSYAPVVEDGPWPHPDRFARRILDRYGCMPAGQLLLRPRPIAVEQSGEQTPDPLTAPLTAREWELVEQWQSAAQVGTDDLTADPARNASLVAGAIFCGRKIGTPDTNDHPLLCVDPSVTAADPGVVELVRHVVTRGQIVNWRSVPLEQRRLRVMELLVDVYGYPVNGAAGLVGNLEAESAVLPNLIEDSKPPTPMRGRNFQGAVTDFTATEVMNRDLARRRGPAKPGIGLAQWTSVDRRAGLFQHRHGGHPAGARILFDLPAQVDFLVTELRADFPRVEATLTDPTVTVDRASDDVVYDFERPGSILDINKHRLPRADPAVQNVFRDRRRLGRAALAAYRAAHPAVAPTGSEEQDPFNRQCAFYAPSGGVVTETDLGNAVRDVALAERRNWFDPAGSALVGEGDASKFPYLVRYWLATVSAMTPSTLNDAEAVATGGGAITTHLYSQLLGATGPAISAAAGLLRAHLLAGAPGGAPAALNGDVDMALVLARESHHDQEAWSSAFVSYCVRRAAIQLGLETDASGAHQGRDALLRVHGGHRFYLHEAHRRTYAAPTEGTYRAFPTANRPVQIGDIIVQDRQTNNVANVWPFARIPDLLDPAVGGRGLHGDIVTYVSAGDHAVAVGGNLSGSIRLRRYPLDANSRLVVAQAQLFTQESATGPLPNLPSINPAPTLQDLSTARIFALLSPVPECRIVPSPLFGGPG